MRGSKHRVSSSIAECLSLTIQLHKERSEVREWRNKLKEHGGLWDKTLYKFGQNMIKQGGVDVHSLPEYFRKSEIRKIGKGSRRELKKMHKDMQGGVSS